MCGIFGYIGRREAEPILINGLRRLEYRGYDSAGLATLTGSRLHLRKSKGRIANLAQLLSTRPAPGCTGISHTRWATHGAATDVNAHPHEGGNGDVVVVHNGVIENYAALKAKLQAEGFTFRSDTDTEVIAHLIAYHHDGDLVEAVRKTLPMLQGTYGLAVLGLSNPDEMVGACLGSPLVLGVGDNEYFLASDPSALLEHTQRVVYLQDHQVCVLTADDWRVFDAESSPVDALVHEIEWDAGDVDRGDFDHYMLKEIHQQPEALVNTMRGRLDVDDASARFGGLNIDDERLRAARRFILTGCGTSYHAALVGEYLFEELAQVPVEVHYASELRYRKYPSDRDAILVAITQSGETADTLAALRESKRRGYHTLSVCNVVGSTIAREAHGGIYLHAGPEIGVASTKAFTSQVMALAMLALHLGRLHGLPSWQGEQTIAGLRSIPDAIRRALRTDRHVRRVAQRYHAVNHFLYMGRQYLYPVALEGALKLKEISYIHAEGYPAAELKHGPIALISSETPSVFLATRGALYEKVMSNIEEVKARGGPVIAIATEGDEEIAAHADEVIYVPDVPHYLQPLVAVVPLQLLAYHIAVLRGCDVDRPRNLAKSVTVE